MRLPVSLLALVVSFGCVADGYAQSRRQPPPNYVQFGRPDQAVGRQVLEDFRGMGIAGDYYLEFDLRVMPRAGRERRVPGRMVGTRDALGPSLRLEIYGDASPVAVLARSGSAAEAWIYRPGLDECPTMLTGEALLEPLAGTDVSAFELQAAFVYWSEFTYEGLTRFRGRPTHVFLMIPAEGDPVLAAGVAGVRIYIDTQFGVLTQAELLKEDGAVWRSLALLDVKRVDGQWILKSADVRNPQTRSRTRLAMTGAALDLQLPPEIFHPDGLNAPMPAPDPASVISME
jgi:hypothetical protein